MARKDKPLSKREQRRQESMMCDNMSFAAAEAYKLLRTNLQFALPEEKKCRIIGITSSVRGEGKSTLAINLAYTLAETGKHVLLVDADMRLPSISSKLSIHASPGLSNVLARLSTVKDAIQLSSILKNWYILPSGDIPPNPSELLGSERMHSFLNKMSTAFEYIVVDLPPVGVVADALVISPWTDGLLVAVRQNYTDRRSLADCMNRINKFNSKFLGFVMTNVSVGETSYKRYKKYGYGYDYGYGYGYGSSERKEKEQTPFENTLSMAEEALSSEGSSAAEDASQESE